MAKEENLRDGIGDGVCSIEAVGSLFPSNLEVVCSVLGIGIGVVEVKVAIAWCLDRGESAC